MLLNAVEKARLARPRLKICYLEKLGKEWKEVLIQFHAPREHHASQDWKKYGTSKRSCALLL